MLWRTLHIHHSLLVPIQMKLKKLNTRHNTVIPKVVNNYLRSPGTQIFRRDKHLILKYSHGQEIRPHHN